MTGNGADHAPSCRTSHGLFLLCRACPLGSPSDQCAIGCIRESGYSEFLLFGNCHCLVKQRFPVLAAIAVVATCVQREEDPQMLTAVPDRPYWRSVSNAAFTIPAILTALQ